MNTLSRFALCVRKRIICSCCGYASEPGDGVVRVTVGNIIKYFHEDCLSDMDGKEALGHFGIEIEEVEI